MERYRSEVGDAEYCNKFGAGAPLEFAGLWYHATNEEDALAKSGGTRHFVSSAGRCDGVYLTRDPRGGAKNVADWEANPWVITVVVSATEPGRDCRLIDGVGEQSCQQLVVRDVRLLCVQRGSGRHRDDQAAGVAVVPDRVVPSGEPSEDIPGLPVLPARGLVRRI